jgi:hypothetical protein
MVADGVRAVAGALIDRLDSSQSSIAVVANPAARDEPERAIRA